MPTSLDSLETGLTVARRDSAVESRDDTPRPADSAPLLGWHALQHYRHWAGYRPSRWRLSRRLPPNMFALAIVVTFVSWNVVRATAPRFAPGPQDIPQSVRDLAAVLFVLCWIPAIQYLRTERELRRPIPFLSLYGCLYSLYYALTPMLGLANFLAFYGNRGRFDPATDYGGPVGLLLIGWLLLCLGYWLVGGLGRGRAWALDRKLGEVRPHLIVVWAFALLALGLTSEVLQRWGWWPDRFAGVGNLLSIVMEVALVLLIALRRRRQMHRWAAWVTLFGTALAIFVSLGGSATARVLFVLFAVVIGVWLECRSMPPHYIVAAAIAVAGCVAIRGVMTDWRIQVWGVSRGEMSAIDRSNLMITLLREKLEHGGASGAISDGWEVIGRRSANVDLVVDVTQRTPAKIPYWNGFTYQSLAGALVPRFLWPDKPRKTLGQDFGHRYRYLSDRDLDTSFNLPVVVEFYINYGTVGLLFGMLMLGMLLRLIEDVINRPGQSLLVSAAAAPLLARLLVMECDLSLMFGGLPLQLPALLLIAIAILWHAGLIPRPTPARPPWYAPLLPLQARR